MPKTVANGERFLAQLTLGDLKKVPFYSFILETCISTDCNRSANCNIRKLSKRDYLF